MRISPSLPPVIRVSGDLEAPRESLGSFTTREAARSFALQRAGNESILRTPAGYEVFSLKVTPRLQRVADTGLTATLSSGYAPTCTDFVIDRAVIETTDLATAIVGSKARAFEMTWVLAEISGGVGPNELAVLRTLAPDPAVVTEHYGAIDLTTLEETLASATRGVVDPEQLERAAAAISRSYGPKQVAVTAAIVERLNGRMDDAALKFKVLAREFTVPLAGGYDDPAAMMTFGQRDFLAVTREDSARCGAAALVAAAIVIGPQAVGRLAARFGVAVEVEKPTPGSLHLLMEQIYLQTRAATGETFATEGLTDEQVNRLAKEIFGSVEPATAIEPGAFELGSRRFALLGVGGSTADHAVMVFRDPRSGAVMQYEPAAIGQAASPVGAFAPLHSRTGKIMVIAGA